MLCKFTQLRVFKFGKPTTRSFTPIAFACSCLSRSCLLLVSCCCFLNSLRIWCRLIKGQVWLCLTSIVFLRIWRRGAKKNSSASRRESRKPPPRQRKPQNFRRFAAGSFFLHPYNSFFCTPQGVKKNYVQLSKR